MASVCGSELMFRAPGPREFCSFYPTNPSNRHSSALKKVARHRNFPRKGGPAPSIELHGENAH